MKLYIKYLAVVLFTTSMISCNKDNNDNMSTPTASTSTFKATLNGTNEVPPNRSLATGSATVTFNNTTKVLYISLSYTGMTPNAGHIHMGALGVSGPPVFAFSSLASPITYTSVPLDAGQESDLKSNLYYVNLHSTTYPDGEIRGQLLKQTTSGGGGY